MRWFADWRRILFYFFLILELRNCVFRLVGGVVVGRCGGGEVRVVVFDKKKF